MTDTQTPERIWVRYSPNGHGAYVSSCEPSDVDDLDVPFVHADLHAAVVAERDQLKERIAFFENASKAYEEICDNRQREIDSLKRKLGYD